GIPGRLGTTLTAISAKAAGSAKEHGIQHERARTARNQESDSAVASVRRRNAARQESARQIAAVSAGAALEGGMAREEHGCRVHVGAGKPRQCALDIVAVEVPEA